MRVFYANSFTITHSEDSLYVVFEFQIDGKGDSVCVVLSPGGGKTLAEALAKHIGEIEAEQGNVEVWKERNRQLKGENDRYIG